MKWSVGILYFIPTCAVRNRVSKEEVNPSLLIGFWIDLKYYTVRSLFPVIYSDRNRDVLCSVMWIGRFSRLSAENVDVRDAAFRRAIDMPVLLCSQQVFSRALCG